MATTMKVRLWLCPNGHYYGSSGDHERDLASLPRLPKPENFGSEVPKASAAKTKAERDRLTIEDRGSRATCGACMEQTGQRVERTRVEVEVELPVAA